MRRVANVYKDEKRGTWYFSLTLGYDRFGKRIQPTRRGFKSQKEAKDAMEELKRIILILKKFIYKGLLFVNFIRSIFFHGINLGRLRKPT